MTRPLVSVVMPAYNAERTVGGAVASVLWQDYERFELVIVDDGSEDATAAIAGAHSGPVRIVQQENKGVAAARNSGIRESRGDLIAFCDADEFLFERHLSALVDVYERKGGIVTANSYWLLPGGIHPSKRRYKGAFPAPDDQRLAILEQNFLSTLALFPRELYDEVGPFDERLRRAEDWEFWQRAIYSGARVSLQREPLALYRWGGDSLSSEWSEMDADIDKIFATVEERFDLNAREREYVRRRRSGPGPRVLSRRGDEALRAGRYAEAADAYREAAALCPTERMLVWKARVLAPAPRLAGPLVRARQLRIERSLGMEERHTR
jgi:glycosyltransferase involved in cell wall biosynthesis